MKRTAVVFMMVVGTASPIAQSVAADIEQCEKPINFNEFKRRLVGETDVIIQTELIESAANRPLAVPSGAATSATQGSNVADSAVSGASVINAASLVLGADAVSSNSDTGTMTVTVNPFAALALRDPSLLTDQDRYEEYETLRRFNAAVSFFGKGQALDQNGDGKVDDAKDATNLDDVVSFELRFQLLGNRDRRARENYRKFFDATAANANAVASNVDSLLDGSGLYEHFQELENKTHRNLIQCPQPDTLEYARAWLEQQPSGRAALSDYRSQKDSYVKSVGRVLDEIDRSFVLTAVTGGTVRKAGFGGDEWTVGLRASWGYEAYNLNANAEYRNANGVGGLPDLDTYKVGAQLERSIDFIPDGRQSTLSLAFAYEFKDGVPSSASDETAKVSLKWALPVTDEASAILSATWANNTELLDGNDDIIGHIGVSFDYERAIAKMMGAAAAKQAAAAEQAKWQ